jgi:hypothetical protein
METTRKQSRDNDQKQREKTQFGQNRNVVLHYDIITARIARCLLRLITIVEIIKSNKGKQVSAARNNFLYV